MTSIQNNPLLEFQKQFNELKPIFEERLKLIEDTSKNIKKMDTAITMLLETEGNKLVSIDVGGKHFKTKLKTLLSRRDSIFYKCIADELEVNKPYSTFWSFDRSPQHFSLILDFLRTGVLNFEQMNDTLLAELDKELQFYGIWSAHKMARYALESVVIVAFTASPQYSSAGNYSIANINDPKNTGGVCVQSPYEIVFELNFPHTLKGCEIKGFNGNTSLWGSNNGENADITVSLTKTGPWKSVGKIPYGFGDVPKEIKFTAQESTKFVRFKHNSYLGISYLKLLK